MVVLLLWMLLRQPEDSDLCGPFLVKKGHILTYLKKPRIRTKVLKIGVTSFQGLPMLVQLKNRCPLKRLRIARKGYQKNNPDNN
tara:strand:+ start:77 stop:328 length:252 start_codon:yes stop_codon:yes gene_type:complete